MSQALPTAASTLALAADIGGTKITGAVVELSTDGQHAQVLAEKSCPTPAADGPQAVLDAMGGVLDNARDSVQRPHEIESIGIASAGVIDTTGRRVTHATDALAGWSGTEVAAYAEQRFGLPTLALNDVHAHGVGEARFGAGAEAGSMLLVAVGTGIGGCLVLDGRVVVGAHGAAGHIGHVLADGARDLRCSCGRLGHLEALASGPGILDLAERLGVRSDLRTSGSVLAQSAHAGEPSAIEVYRAAGTVTGEVIGGLLNALDVAVVVLSGGVAEVGEPWLSAVRDGVRTSAMDVVADTPVVTATTGAQAALLGAAAHAVERFAVNDS